MSTERLISGGDQSAVSSSHSLRYCGEAAAARIFEELPTATIVSVSRPDASDITPLLLSYTIELQYKQVSSILCRLCFPGDYHGLWCESIKYIFCFSHVRPCIMRLYVILYVDGYAL
ncbi:UNVERIFIED_CONTAM: Phospholipase D zeta 1 [Sesamum latifolium]|uniref:Phospholipase D zeta 1 n=1 Tax=Sesamum latifolium TaxID=2727402 RepID=A0AAW2XKN5_9LAMI